MILTISWEEFTNSIDELTKEGEDFINPLKSISNNTDFDKIKVKITDWETKCQSFLKTSFDIEVNKYFISYRNTNSNNYQIPGVRKELNQLINELVERVNKKRNNLIATTQILTICDSIINPEITNLVDRNSYSVSQTLELILEKLYKLYHSFGGNAYSIKDILEGNGIILKDRAEDRDLGNVLEERGYVELVNLGDIYAKITIEGRLYFEDQMQVLHENYDKISNSATEVNSRIDEVIEHLEKLGLGHQILFEELEELKELYTKLNKKNLGQVLKGKLFDLGLAKIAEKDTLEFIYNKITSIDLRLS